MGRHGGKFPSMNRLQDFSGPSALEQRLDAFVFKALPSGSFNGDVDADSEDMEDLSERKVKEQVSRVSRHLFK